MTSNAEDISSFLAVRKLQDSSRSHNKKVMVSLAALLAVVTLAIFFINFARHPENSAKFAEEQRTSEHLEATLPDAEVVGKSDTIPSKLYIKGTRVCPDRPIPAEESCPNGYELKMVGSMVSGRLEFIKKCKCKTSWNIDGPLCNGKNILSATKVGSYTQPSIEFCMEASNNKED